MNVSRRVGCWLVGAGLAAALVACGTPRPTPAALPELASGAGAAAPLWRFALGAAGPGFTPALAQGRVAWAAQDGRIAVLDAASGTVLWQAQAHGRVAAGVGFDGRWLAVVSEDNELQVFERERLVWRGLLPSRVLTAPLVAGERVFVHALDRSVAAFDALDGRLLWRQGRSTEPLALAQPALLAPYRDSVIAGLGPRVVVLDGVSGTPRADLAYATPRGSNEAERLADVLAPSARIGQVVCARAYQVAVACADLAQSRVLWSRATGGVNGVASDGRVVILADASSRIGGWRLSDGETVWTNTTLAFRELQSPAAVGDLVLFGDAEGLVHLLSARDGKPVARWRTDESGVLGAPLVGAHSVFVATRGGTLYAFARPTP